MPTTTYPLIAPTIVRYTMHYDMTNGRVGDVVWDLSVDTGFGTTDREAELPGLAVKVQDNWQTDVCPQVTSPVKYTGMTWIDLNSLDSNTGVLTFNPAKPVNSGVAAEPTPPNTTWFIKKICAHSRRQRTGRCYLPGPLEANVDKAGKMGGSYLSGCQTAFNNWRSHMATSGELVGGLDTALRVVHVKGFDSDHIANEWESSDITALVVSDTVATQRRRLRG